MFIGEALAGDGNEISHIDLLIGDKNGPVGYAFANALARQSEGHSNLLAVLTPNLAVKPSTVLITKVTLKDMRQAVQMFGPIQAGVSRAVADAVGEGTLPKARCEDIVIVCGVFVHPAAGLDENKKPLEGDLLAESNKKLHNYNYDATKMAIANAMTGKPTVDEMLTGKDSANHPFKGFN